MRKIYYISLAVVNFVLYPIYKKVIKEVKPYSEFQLFSQKLNCPYFGYIGFVWIFLNFPEYRSVVYHRFRVLKKIYSCIYKPQILLQIDTPSNRIGTGLMIWHGFSTIINADRIGDNCTIWHQVTVGNKLDDGECKPIIEDNVKICTGAIVIGNIHIGKNSIIGAGSVVVKDVPDNVIVAGIPAKVIRYID